MHEHVFVLSTGGNAELPEQGRRGETSRRCGLVIERAQIAGRLHRPYGDRPGRCIPRIQRVAAQTDLNILVATGVHLPTTTSLFYFHYQGPGQSWAGLNRWLPLLFVRDIFEEARECTGVKARYQMRDRMFRGDAGRRTRPSRGWARRIGETGARFPLTLTRAIPSAGSSNKRIFQEEGVDLSRDHYHSATPH